MPPRNLANALRNLGRRREAVDLVWRHIGEAVDAVDLAQAQAQEWTVKSEKLVIAPGNLWEMMGIYGGLMVV